MSSDQIIDPHSVNVAKNASRLYHDSRILSLAGRHESATSHIILAIEEIGKSLIAEWGVKNVASNRSAPNHIEKQAATLALLAAHELCTPRGQKMLRAYKATGRNPNFVEFGGYCEQFAQARSGFFERLRMTLVYEDRDPPLDKRATIEAVKSGKIAKELRAFFKEAIKRRRSKSTMKLAAIIYENDLGRL